MADPRRLTAIIAREESGHTVLCPEYDIASQGATIEEARDHLVEALGLFFECAGPAAARTDAGNIAQFIRQSGIPRTAFES
jgi:hypothetical protein